MNIVACFSITAGRTSEAPGEKPDWMELVKTEKRDKKATEEIDEPLSDIHASAEYCRHLAQVLTRRGLAAAVERAAAGT